MDGLLSNEVRDIIALVGLVVAIYQIVESVAARARTREVRSPVSQVTSPERAAATARSRSIEDASLQLGLDYLLIGAVGALASLLSALSATQPPGLKSIWVSIGLVCGTASQWIFLALGIAVRMSVRQRAKPRLSSSGWAIWAIASLASVAIMFLVRPTLDPASPPKSWLPLFLWMQCGGFLVSSAGALAIIGVAGTSVRALIRMYKGGLSIDEVLALPSNLATWKRLFADVSFSRSEKT